MRVSEPWLFLLLVLIPPVLWWGRSSGGKIRFSHIGELKKIQPLLHFEPRHILLFLRGLVLVLIVVALARPQSGKKFSEVRSDGVDIFLAIDTSGSMQALDFKLDDKPVSRLEMVKNVVVDFVKNRPHDRLGLIVFGEEAFTQCPLTLDHGVLLEFLKGVEIGMAGDATAVGSAIGTAVNRMKDLKAKSKVVIALTDGRSNAGRLSPEKAAEIAHQYGIKVYTIGVGTKGKAPFLVNTVFGKQYVYQDVDLDEEALQKMAQATQAQYFRATATDELRGIYQQIDRLEKTEATVKEYTEYYELFHWFLLPAILAFLAETVLAHTRLRKIP